MEALLQITLSFSIYLGSLCVTFPVARLCLFLFRRYIQFVDFIISMDGEAVIDAPLLDIYVLFLYHFVCAIVWLNFKPHSRATISLYILVGIVQLPLHSKCGGITVTDKNTILSKQEIQQKGARSAIVTLPGKILCTDGK